MHELEATRRFFGFQMLEHGSYAARCHDGPRQGSAIIRTLALALVALLRREWLTARDSESESVRDAVSFHEEREGHPGAPSLRTHVACLRAESFHSCDGHDAMAADWLRVTHSMEFARTASDEHGQLRAPIARLLERRHRPENDVSEELVAALGLLVHDCS